MNDPIINFLEFIIGRKLLEYEKSMICKYIDDTNRDKLIDMLKNIGIKNFNELKEGDKNNVQ